MEEILKQKGLLEEELDKLPKQVRVRKTRGANIAGIVIFSIAMTLFSATLMLIMFAMLDGGVSRQEFHDMIFALVLVIEMPIAVLGTALMFSYKPMMNVAYSIPAAVGWIVQIIIFVVIFEVAGGPDRYGSAILLVLSFLIFNMIVPMVLFALTYPPFCGEDLTREEYRKKQEFLLAGYFNLTTQMEMMSPMIAAEMKEKYSKYASRNL